MLPKSISAPLILFSCNTSYSVIASFPFLGSLVLYTSKVLDSARYDFNTSFCLGILPSTIHKYSLFTLDQLFCKDIFLSWFLANITIPDVSLSNLCTINTLFLGYCFFTYVLASLYNVLFSLFSVAIVS